MTTLEAKPGRLLRIARRLALGVVVLAMLLVAAGGIYLLTLPSVSDAAARTRAILAAHHQPASSLPAPRRLVDSVVSVEDEHFYDDVFVNVVSGIGRAALATLHTDQDPGGSTIEQQLAKQLYGRGHGLLGTLHEIGLGVKLALTYSKPQIMRMYLNAVYYGNGNWGVRAASAGYFRTTPGRLTWSEAAMLAGLLQAPSLYDPKLHYALAKKRQRHVLDQLVVNHYLSAGQAQGAYAAPLPLAGP